MGQFNCGAGGYIMTIQITDQKRVRTIALNRPERLNAFSNNSSPTLLMACKQPPLTPRSPSFS
jgi:hypothetical protein